MRLLPLMVEVEEREEVVVVEDRGVVGAGGWRGPGEVFVEGRIEIPRSISHARLFLKC